MRVLICGARAWTDVELAERVLDRIHAERGIHLGIVGGASGADTIGENWLSKQHIPFIRHLPKWHEHGQEAGFVRNLKMLDENPDLVVAFIKGPARGTKHTLRNASKRGIEILWVGENGAESTFWVQERPQGV